MTVPIACVIGWPVEHSRSPVIHRFWLKEFGIAGDYVLQAVEPERVAAFLADFSATGYVGGNVTVPHKEAAFAAVAAAGQAARAIGAVNTIWLEDGRLIGDNTDSYGFLANLDQNLPGWDRRPGSAIVLGAGGAARAVVFSLLERGFGPVHIVNRTPSRAAALADRFGEKVRPGGWEDIHRIGNASILVNTTTLGMTGSPPLPLDDLPDNEDLIVTDIVYVPLVTPLLAAARTRGLRTVDGLGMLLHQAVPGFERWFGRRPTVTSALRAAVLATMGGD